MDVRFTDNTKEVQERMNKALMIGLERVGQFVEGEAKLNAPVDTGRLRNSINYTTPSEIDSEMVVIVGTPVEYAWAQEVGSYEHKYGRSPFLRPAVEENKQAIEQILTDALKKVTEA